MADSSAPAGTAARLAELARRVAVSLDLQATLQLVADAVVEDLSFLAVAVNIERPGGMYEVVAVAGPDDVKGLLGQVAPGSAYLEILDASEAWGRPAVLQRAPSAGRPEPPPGRSRIARADDGT